MPCGALTETSKHYGPYCTALPDALTPLLDRYADMLALEGEGGDEAYLFGPNHALDRPYESAGWSMFVKRAFAKHSPSGQEVAPKVLRSSFITWIRGETTCPAVLKAAAHACVGSLQPTHYCLLHSSEWRAHRSTLVWTQAKA